ncbi:MAG: hypothetical protein ACLGPL_07785 [Acidobacteriota bacterium]
MEENSDRESLSRSGDEMELFERVLDKEISISDDIKLSIRVSVAGLDEVAGRMHDFLPTKKSKSKTLHQRDDDLKVEKASISDS